MNIKPFNVLNYYYRPENSSQPPNYMGYVGVVVRSRPGQKELIIDIEQGVGRKPVERENWEEPIQKGDLVRVISHKEKQLPVVRKVRLDIRGRFRGN